MSYPEVIATTNYRRNFQFNKAVLIFVLFAFILTPALNFIPGMPAVRLEDIVLLIWLFFVFPFLRLKLSAGHKLRLAFLGAFFVLLPIAILNGIINGYGGTLADFNQYIRFFKYISVYLLSVYVFSSASRTDMLKLIDYILWLGVLVFLLALSQYVNVLGLNEIYVQHVAPTQYDTLVGNYGFPRPVAMIGNPNELGFLFVIFSLLSLILLVDKNKNGRKIKPSIFFAIYFFGVLITLSRGSIAALVAGLLALFGWMFLHSKIIVKTKITVALICLIVLGFLILNHPLVYEKFTWRFMAFLSLAEDVSFSTRLVNWQENIDIIKQHPILGVGPLRRAAFENAADNEWLLLWRSYGLIGVSLFIGLMTTNLFFKCAKEVKVFSIVIAVSVFVYMIPTAAFHSLVLFPFLLVLLAIIDTKNKGFFVDYSH